MYRMPRKCVEGAVREQTQAPLSYWECPCGCKAGVLYGRDVRALWVASELSTDRSVRVLGIETQEELEAYIASVINNLSAKGYASDVRDVFQAAFSGAPS
jgi:hypothetical protein